MNRSRSMSSITRSTVTAAVPGEEDIPIPKQIVETSGRTCCIAQGKR